MAVKVKELAKEARITVEELIDLLRKRYFVDIEDEAGEIDDKIAGLVRVRLGVSKPVQKKVKKTPKNGEEAPEPEKTEKSGRKKKEEKEAAEPVSPEISGKKKTEKAPAGEKEPRTAGTAAEPGKAVTVEKAQGEAAAPAEAPAEEPKAPQLKGIGKVIVVKSAADAEKEREAQKASGASATSAAGEKKTEKPGLITEEESEFFKKRKPIFKLKKAPGPVIPATEEEAEDVPLKPVVKKVFKLAKPEVKEKHKIAAEEIKIYTGTDFKKLEMLIPASIRAIAVKVDKRPNDLIQYLLKKGLFININQELDEGLVRTLLKDLGYELVIPKTMEEDLMAEHRETEKLETEKRAPIVTFMGHVDHGKTSLLDYIRKTMVAKSEKGGITQHIGAYRVQSKKGSVTFLDTPGHEAFTAMRARGANVTDVVVIVVAADDGVMPQTKEAIDHARAADVPIIVAINKVDLPRANPDKVRIELQKEGLIAEVFGGKTVMVEVSARTGQGVDDLVDMLLLESELMELKANPNLRARGVVVESKKTADQGVVATVLVKNGTLKVGDMVLCGIYYGKVKAMLDYRGERIEEALPSTPAAILGLEGLPQAGDEFFVVKDEKKARTLSSLKQGEEKKSKLAGSQRVTLEDFHSRMLQGNIKELRIILKADVQGSVEALTRSLTDISHPEVKVAMAHTMVGDINESDVMLAMVSSAVIIGFNVKIDPKAEALAKQEKIDVKVYGIIYEAIEDVKAALEGLLEPVEQEVLQGVAQIKEVFPSKKGKAAGCLVTKGTVHRKDRIRVRRAKEVIFEGSIDDLKRFKDDVREVKEGVECGLSFQNFNEFRVNDVIEAFIIEKVARRLER